LQSAESAVKARIGIDSAAPLAECPPVAFLIPALSAALAGIMVWLWCHARAATLAERARVFAESVAKLEVELAALRVHAAALEGERAALQEGQSRLLETFKALSADALVANNTSFLALARESFAKLHQQSAGELERRQQAIDSLVKPLKESLEKVDAKIGEIEKTRANAYGALSEQLKSLGTAQTTLQAEAAKLSTALRSTTTAGTWGELQLRRVVELSGMSAYCDFAEQQTSGAFRADLVVRLPGGQQIVVDAKAPDEAYREAANASDENFGPRSSPNTPPKSAAISTPSEERIIGSISSPPQNSWCSSCRVTNSSPGRSRPTRR
jgi:DNA recombination protein RmuC